MSDLYAEKNTETTYQLFNKRKLYMAQLMARNDKNIVDFFRGEKILYGRVTPRYLPVVVGEAQLTALRSANSDVEAPRALNFVADMFNEVCLQFQKCATNGQISPHDPFLSNLRAYKAYVSPSRLYLEYRSLYSSLVGQTIKENGANIANFQQFVDRLLTDMRPLLATKPMTYTAFVKSTSCSIMSSGLAIEIADLDYINDEEKVQTLINSPNWDFFVRTCNSYGFMVDLHVPWRIVADVNSTEMMKIANEYGYSSVMTQAYGLAMSQYIPQFIAHLLEMYNASTYEAFEKVELCSDGTITTHRVTPQRYTTTQLEKKYGTYYFVELYMQLRLYEEKPDMPEAQRRKIIAEFLQFTRSTKSMAAISFGLEQFLNKPFDKSGSLSYLIQKSIAQASAAFAAGEIDNLQIHETGPLANNVFSSY